MTKFYIGAFIFILIIGIGCVYTVDQTKQVLILRFGEPVRVVNAAGENDPGLHFKLPYIFETVIRFDKRILHFDAEPRNLYASEVQDVAEVGDEADPEASDTSRIVVDAFSKYRIVDPLKFHQTVKTESGLNSRLDSILDNTMRQVVGRFSLGSFLTEQRALIMKQVRDKVNEEMQIFGVDIEDVRIKRADLPKDNFDRVIQRMIAEREKEAREHRANGDKEAKIISSTAEKERTVILAKAGKQSQILRGEGEAEATRIFAEAFGKDEDFFAFYRSMQAYRQTLKEGDTTMVLSPDSEFLRYFGDIEGKKGTR